MLKTLTIRNLVLIEEAHLDFEAGLTVITGETGAGKTALIEALRLTMGERADVSKVRKGAEKAYISATFEGEIEKELAPVFDELALPFPEDEPLMISREILKEGKGRAFVNGRLAPLAFLSKLAPHLVEFVGQNAQLLLKSSDEQRSLLDQYGKIDLSNFQASFQLERKISSELSQLVREKEEQPLENLQDRLKILDTLSYSSEAEQALFEEFFLLSNAEEITSHCNEVISLTDSAMATCHKLQIQLDHLPIEEGMQMAKEAHLQLAELQSLSQSLMARIDRDPTRLVHLEEHLKAIDQAKKSFGKDLEKARRELSKRVERLSHIDEAILETMDRLASAKKKTDREALNLTEKRQEAARQLEEKLSNLLRNLNIHSAEVQIRVEPILRTLSGQDHVTLLLRANKGEKMASVKESASGGEISRLLFCVKLILADQIEAKTFVFDEIDAGVGGQTAALMGKQMSQLSKGRSVLCITHFPQVARCGKYHFQVSKHEQKERTLCSIQLLNPEEREEEYLRMIGGAPKKDSPHHLLSL